MYLPTRLPGRWTVQFPAYTWYALPVFVSGDRIGIMCGGKATYHSAAAINAAGAWYIGTEFRIDRPCLGLEPAATAG